MSELMEHRDEAIPNVTPRDLRETLEDASVKGVRVETKIIHYLQGRVNSFESYQGSK